MVPVEEAPARATPGQGLDVLFAPRTVAVIGVSRRPGSIGAALLANIPGGGFRGRLFAVHPEAAEVDGVPAFPSLAAVSVEVDLAVVVTPAAAVEAEVRDCAEYGVRGVVVISSGWWGPTAWARQHRLNPVKVLPRDQGVVVVDARIRVGAR